MDKEKSLAQIFGELENEYLQLYGLEATLKAAKKDEPSLASLRRSLIDVLFDKFFSREDFFKIYSVIPGELLEPIDKKSLKGGGFEYIYRKGEGEFDLGGHQIFKIDSMVYPSGYEDFIGIGYIGEGGYNDVKFNNGYIDLPKRTKQFLCLGSSFLGFYVLSRDKQNSSVELYTTRQVYEEGKTSWDRGNWDDKEKKGFPYSRSRKIEKIERDDLCKLKSSSRFEGFYRSLNLHTRNVYEQILRLKGEIPKEILKKDYAALKKLSEKKK